jgi:hypothetical protein
VPSVGRFREMLTVIVADWPSGLSSDSIRQLAAPSVALRPEQTQPWGQHQQQRFRQRRVYANGYTWYNKSDNKRLWRPPVSPLRVLIVCGTRSLFWTGPDPDGDVTCGWVDRLQIISLSQPRDGLHHQMARKKGKDFWFKKRQISLGSLQTI